MNGWWFSGLLMVFTVVNSKVDLDSSLRVAHCRANCLYKLKMPNPTNDSICQGSTDCFQCWDTCRSSQVTDNTLTPCYQQNCGPGCLEACRFNSLYPIEPPPLFLTQHEGVLSFQDLRVSWPAYDSNTAPVYLIMGRLAGRSWSELYQTLDRGMDLRADVDLDSIRVLVVDWRGLTKVFSPRAEYPLFHIIRSLGMEAEIGLKQSNHRRSHIHRSKTSSKQKAEPRELWKLKYVSTIHQSGLVLAQISWSNPQTNTADDHLMFLVTWEMEGGVLRGNLLTNSSCVTLSLWPDTVYKIEVSVIDSDLPNSQSEPLVLDTHYVPATTPSSTGAEANTQVTKGNPLLQENLSSGRLLLVPGLAVMVSMFLVSTLVLICRWIHHSSLSHTKLVDEETGDALVYRDFPAVEGLTSEKKKENEGLFSSTDNLLESN